MTTQEQTKLFNETYQESYNSYFKDFIKTMAKDSADFFASISAIRYCNSMNIYCPMNDDEY